jgi:hypothetical protein
VSAISAHGAFSGPAACLPSRPALRGAQGLHILLRIFDFLGKYALKTNILAHRRTVS